MRTGAKAGIAALAIVALGGGYVALDAYDVVPGFVTVAPVPDPPTPFPTPSALAPASAAQVLSALDPNAPVPTVAALKSMLDPMVKDPALGPAVALRVVDAATGDVLYDSNGNAALTPASTTKLFTSVAALSLVDPGSTLPTTVVQGSDPAKLFLVGGGDMMLASGKGSPEAVNGRAGLEDLAAQVAGKLKLTGTTTVSLAYDDSFFTGPNISPTVDASDVNNGFVRPVASMAVDIARIDGKESSHQSDPALSTAKSFAQSLAAQGITVSTVASQETAPTDGATLGRVDSAPLREVVGYMLEHSDNTIAEVIGRLAAGAADYPRSFEGATKAIIAEVGRLGVDTKSVSLSDASGLSNGSQVTALALTGLVQTAMDPAHPNLRSIIETVPISGLTGTLSDRYDNESSQAAAGYVRAKTGTLKSVVTLAGVTVDVDGRSLVFAMLTNGFEGAAAVPRKAVDATITSLQGCGCQG